MVKEAIGYKFNVEQAAINAANSLKAHYFAGRPPAPPEGYVTTEWVTVEENTGISGSFFYFHGDFQPVLGSPSTFDIDINTEV